MAVRPLSMPDENGGEPLQLLVDDERTGGAMEFKAAMSAAAAIRDAWDANGGVQLEVTKCGNCDAIHFRFWCGGVLILDYHQPQGTIPLILADIFKLLEPVDAHVEPIHTGDAPGDDETLIMPAGLSPEGDPVGELVGEIVDVVTRRQDELRHPAHALQALAGAVLTGAYHMNATEELAQRILRDSADQVPVAYAQFRRQGAH